MSDLVDAYAEHIYWIYNDSGRLEYRLRDVAHLVNDVLPPEERKPTYMMEYGIRGVANCGRKPTFSNLYYAADPSCPEIWRTNIAGFQQFWFNSAPRSSGSPEPRSGTPTGPSTTATASTSRSTG